MARASVLRPIGHEDRLSIVDHLGELRARLFFCVSVLAVAFGVCFWQNHALLRILNHALPSTAKTSPNHISGLTGDSAKAGRALGALSQDLRGLAGSPTLSARDRGLFADAALRAQAAASALPRSQAHRLPITTGVGEPFTVTLTVSAYFALLFALPVLIYQAYAFILPALNPHERRVALPLMILAPILFIVGVAFTYLAVLPPAVRFLQGYNSQNFDILVQAKTLYNFEILAMLGIGLAFQLPIGLLGLQQIGAINSRTLTRHWRYAVIVIAIIAAALPGVDPVTTALEMVPLLLLYLLSIVMLRFADRRAAARAANELQGVGGESSPS